MRLTNTWKLACVFVIFLLIILLVEGGKNDNEKKVKPRGKPNKNTNANKSVSEKEKNAKKKQKEKSKDSEENDDDEEDKVSKVFVPKESPQIIVDTPTVLSEADLVPLDAPQINISDTQLGLDSTLNTSFLNITNHTLLTFNSTLNISLVNSSIVRPTLNATLFDSFRNNSSSTTDSRYQKDWPDYQRYHGYHRFHDSGCGGSNTKEPYLEKVEKDLIALWAYVQGMSQPVHVHVYNSENAEKSPGAERPETSKRREHVEPKDKSSSHTFKHSHNHTSKHSHNHTFEHSHNHTFEHSHNHTHGHNHSKHHHHIGMGHGHKHAHHHGGARDYHHHHAHQHHDNAHQHYDHAHHKDGAEDSHHGHRHQHYHRGHEKDMKDTARPYHRPDFQKHETHVHIQIVQTPQKREHTGKEGPQVDIHHGVHVEHKHTEEHKPEMQKEYKPMTARCDLQTFTKGSNITGVVLFTQKSEDELVVDVKIKGFPVSEPTLNETSNETSAYSLHGFHVHEFGDLSGGCSSLGGHFNPEGVDHGLRNHQVHGHVGDWGNLEVGSDRQVDKQFSVTAASLTGPYSILGRGIVVHAQRDDLGLGGSVASKTTGDAGGRIACCVIVATKPFY